MSEFESEPVKGLPQRLPPGEVILWQGQPDWRSLAIRAFHVRKIAIYFGAILLWRIVAGFYDGQALSSMVVSNLGLPVMALAAIGIASLLAWLYARTSVFTVTNRRIVLRYGVALPWSVNLPYSTVESAGVSIHADNTADIPLTLSGTGRISYLHLWPFARPWAVNRPQPMLRSVPDGAEAARILAHALASYSKTSPDGVVAMPIAIQKKPEPISVVAAA
jgi:hypothetical protein